MDRRIGESEDQDPAAEHQATSTPIEALVVGRDSLIRLLRSRLTELHEHLREVAGTSMAQEDLLAIKYWGEVLVWVKERHGVDVVLVERMERRQ
jgi:hypothetical protein